MTAEDSTRMLADTSELIIGAKDVPDSVSAAGYDLSQNDGTHKVGLESRQQRQAAAAQEGPLRKMVIPETDSSFITSTMG